MHTRHRAAFAIRLQNDGHTRQVPYAGDLLCLLSIIRASVHLDPEPMTSVVALSPEILAHYSADIFAWHVRQVRPIEVGGAIALQLTDAYPISETETEIAVEGRQVLFEDYEPEAF